MNSESEYQINTLKGFYITKEPWRQTPEERLEELILDAAKEQKIETALKKIIGDIEAQSPIPLNDRLNMLQNRYPSMDIRARFIVDLSDKLLMELKDENTDT